MKKINSFLCLLFQSKTWDRATGVINNEGIRRKIKTRSPKICPALPRRRWEVWPRPKSRPISGSTSRPVKQHPFERIRPSGLRHPCSLQKPLWEPITGLSCSQGESRLLVVSLAGEQPSNTQPWAPAAVTFGDL